MWWVAGVVGVASVVAAGWVAGADGRVAGDIPLP